MGNIIDMAVKANDSKATYSIGELVTASSTGTVTTITADSGKDLYYAGGTVNIYNTRVGVSIGVFKIDVLANSATIDTWQSRIADGFGTDNHKFNVVVGKKVTATQTLSMKLSSNLNPNSCTIYGVLYGWQEDSGVSPQI